MAISPLSTTAKTSPAATVSPRRLFRAVTIPATRAGTWASLSAFAATVPGRKTRRATVPGPASATSIRAAATCSSVMRTAPRGPRSPWPSPDPVAVAASGGLRLGGLGRGDALDRRGEAEGGAQGGRCTPAPAPWRRRREPRRRGRRGRASWRWPPDGEPTGVAARAGSAARPRSRIRRFNAEGLAAFEDHPRSGRPPTYSAEQVARGDRRRPDRPRGPGPAVRVAGRWTGWPPTCASTRASPSGGAGSTRSCIRKGLRWRQQETWFGERVDPEFAEKGGASSRSTPRRPRLRRRLPRRDGAGSGQELPGPRLARPRPPPGGAGQAGDRLRPARQGLRLRRLQSGDRRRFHAALPGPQHRQLGRLPGGGRGLAAAEVERVYAMPTT